MQQALKVILEIQDLDMKMLRLMSVRKDRQKELKHIYTLRQDLKSQLEEKEEEIQNLSKSIIIEEHKIQEIKENIKKLEAKQSSIKKVEEFNALNQEISQAERARLATEQKTSDLIDKKNLEEEIVAKIKESLEASEENTKALEKEIKKNIELINQEGQELKTQRDELIKQADPQIFFIYEKLLNNKKDRVLVPLENRICSGCHIALTAHHENLVRKGERLIFCEHCSRILYWPETDALEGETTVKRRRRRKTKA